MAPNPSSLPVCAPGQTMSLLGARAVIFKIELILLSLNRNSQLYSNYKYYLLTPLICFVCYLWKSVLLPSLFYKDEINVPKG